MNEMGLTIEFGDVFSIADAYHIPASVTIELCTTCNLRCKHCYIPKHDNSGLGYDTITDIFRQLRRMGTHELVLTGGEIFLIKDILKIIQLGRDMGFDIVLFSNATLVTDDVARALGEMYVASFSTSIYSLNDDVHDSITKVDGSLKKTLLGLQLLKKYGVPVEVKTMVMEYNAHEIQGIYEYCRKNNFNCVVSPFMFPKSNKDDSPIQMRITGEKLFNMIPIINDIVQFEPQERNDDDFMCTSIQHSFGIDAEGNVMPCNAMFYPVGNIYKKTLKEIWESEELKKIQGLRFSDLKKCKNCDKSSYCVRCAGIALSETGNMCSSFGYACQVAEARKNLFERR